MLAYVAQFTLAMQVAIFALTSPQWQNVQIKLKNEKGRHIRVELDIFFCIDHWYKYIYALSSPFRDFKIVYIAMRNSIPCNEHIQCDFLVCSR